MTKITLRKRSGRNALFADIHFGGKRIQYGLGISVEPGHWDAEANHLAETHPDYMIRKGEIDLAILDLKRAIFVLDAQGEEITLEALQKYLSPEKFVERAKEAFKKAGGVMPKTFFEKYEEWQQAKKAHLRDSTMRSFVQLKNYMEAYEEFEGYQFQPETFSEVQFGRFIQFLLFHFEKRGVSEEMRKIPEYRGLQFSTLSRRMRMLKSFLRWAYPERDWSYVRFTAPQVEDIVVLEEHELRQLIDYEVSGHMELVKDLFVFMCLTGMRYSDTQRFDQSWVRGGLLEFRMLKTGGRATPPIFKTTDLILIKYGFTLPKVPNPVLNRYIKELFEEIGLNRKVPVSHVYKREVTIRNVPLHEAVTAHTARRTFITLALSKGIPVQDVMRMSGHSDYKTLRPYMALVRDNILHHREKWDI